MHIGKAAPPASEAMFEREMSEARFERADDQDVSFAKLVENNRRLLLVVAMLAAVFWTILYLQFTVDDAYISFRYGHVLAEHHVWNWNPTGARVEAYTSAIYTFLAILPAFAHVSIPLFFKLFGLLCVGTMGYRLWTRSQSLFAAVLGMLLLCADPWVWIHAYSGLETPLYMLLVLEMALCVAESSTAKPAYAYAVALMLPMTRPEGFVFAAVGVGLLWLRRKSQPKELGSFAVAVATGAVYFLARWHYFHHLLPNPFYVKVAHSSLREMAGSLASNLSWSKGYILSLLLVILLSRTVTSRVFSLCGFVLTMLLFAPHNMMMNYSDRFYFQIAFPIMLIFLVVEDVAGMSRLASVSAAVLLLAITAKDLTVSLTYFPALMEAHVDLGKRLAPYAKDHTLLIGDAGAGPYYSDWVTYDYLGLCTDSIAKNGLSLPLLRTLHPDLIVVYSSKRDGSDLFAADSSVATSAQGIVLDYVEKSGEYKYAGASRWGAEYLVEFLRTDTADHDALQRALQANSASSDAFQFSFKQLIMQQYVPWR